MQLSDIQQAILQHLQELNSWADINSIAQTIDVHPNSVRNALRKLNSYGYIERSLQRDGNKGRPLFIYRAATGQLPFFERVNSSIATGGPNEKALLEALLRGEYYGSLSDSPNLEADVANTLRRMGMEVHLEKDNICVVSRYFYDLESIVPGIQGRTFKFFIQEAIGERGVVEVVDSFSSASSHTSVLRIHTF